MAAALSSAVALSAVAHVKSIRKSAASAAAVGATATIAPRRRRGSTLVAASSAAKEAPAAKDAAAAVSTHTHTHSLPTAREESGVFFFPSRLQGLGLGTLPRGGWRCVGECYWGE